MEDNLRPLRDTDINPAYVLQEVHKHVTQIRELYIVTVMEDGSPVVHTCGDLAGMTYASLCLQNAALGLLNGWEEETWTPPPGA